MFKNSILNISFGQGAGNIGQLMEQQGILNLAINTSKQDLDTLNVKHKYLIKNGQGCGKDRSKSKKLVINDFENILSVINNILDSNTAIKHIFVGFTMGGGSGSGGGPMLAKLIANEYSNVNVCVYAVIPSKSEPFKAQYNACECYRELIKIENLGSMFFLDNNKHENKFVINRYFVDDLVAFLKIPDEDKSLKGNIDIEEMNTILSCNLMINISVTDENNHKVKPSILVDTECDGFVKYIALSNAKQNLLKDIQTSVGYPLDAFYTFNNRKINVIVLAGLSLPSSSMNEIFDLVNQRSTMITRESTTKELKLNDIFSSNKKKKEEIKRSRKDIFAEFI
jgi:hypothetical protein